MKIKVHEVGKSTLMECGYGSVKLSAGDRYILAIDGATDKSGITVFNSTKRVPEYILELASDIKSGVNKSVRNAIRYKLEFKNILKELLLNNLNIKYVSYEEPVMSEPNAIKVLYALASTVEEIIIENESSLSDTVFEFVSNKTWKKILLGDDMPSKSNSALEKQAVKKKIIEIDKKYEVLGQDAMDSLGIAIVKDRELHGECKNIKIQKKYTKFDYLAVFDGSDSDSFDGAVDVYIQLDDIPDSVKENGLKLVEMHKGDDFDQLIYDSMEGEDIPLIIRAESKKIGKIILRNRLTNEKNYTYIYAIVWRKRRK